MDTQKNSILTGNRKRIIHHFNHPLAGQTVEIKSGQFKGSAYTVENWWDIVSGGSWKTADGNPACIQYALRSGIKDKLPSDDEVLYGKIGNYGHLIHNSEI